MSSLIAKMTKLCFNVALNYYLLTYTKDHTIVAYTYSWYIYWHTQKTTFWSLIDNMRLEKEQQNNTNYILHCTNDRQMTVFAMIWHAAAHVNERQTRQLPRNCGCQSTPGGIYTTWTSEQI